MRESRDSVGSSASAAGRLAAAALIDVEPVERLESLKWRVWSQLRLTEGSSHREHVRQSCRRRVSRPPREHVTSRATERKRSEPPCVLAALALYVGFACGRLRRRARGRLWRYDLDLWLRLRRAVLTATVSVRLQASCSASLDRRRRNQLAIRYACRTALLATVALCARRYGVSPSLA